MLQTSTDAMETDTAPEEKPTEIQPVIAPAPETVKTTDASLDITEQDEVLDYDEEMPHE